ncbi:hypothetical protein ABG067_003395 [Albugo candida]
MTGSFVGVASQLLVISPMTSYILRMKRFSKRVRVTLAIVFLISVAAFSIISEQTNPASNLYSLMGIRRDASPNDIKRAFRLRSVELHPDKNPSENAEEEFNRLRAAFDILSNAEKRRLYDCFGEDAIAKDQMTLMIETGLKSFSFYAIWAVMVYFFTLKEENKQARSWVYCGEVMLLIFETNLLFGRRDFDLPFSLFSFVTIHEFVTAIHSAFPFFMNGCRAISTFYYRDIMQENLTLGFELLKSNKVAGEYPLAVALSGGADSLTLTFLLDEYLRKWEQEKTVSLLAITVDHQLRIESREEAEYVCRICKERAIAHVIASSDWSAVDPRQLVDGKPKKSRMQVQARNYRYASLKQMCQKFGVKYLFVGHTLDDQEETILLRLARGSGLNGLAGMEALTKWFWNEEIGDHTYLVRPLLSVSKSRLQQTCTQRFHQDWVEDPSNHSDVFDRVRIRKAMAKIRSEKGEGAFDCLLPLHQIASEAKKEFKELGFYLVI